MAPTSINIVSSTDKGIEREHNEDYHSFCTDLSAKKPEWSFFAEKKIESLGKKGAILICADGMGGMNAGEVASKIAVEEVSLFLEKNAKKDIKESEAKRLMEKATLQANKSIIKHQKANPETEGMGTTIVIAWIVHNRLFVSWVGDSRCYVFNKKNGFVLLTKDHSYVQELIDNGTLTYEQAFYHPESNIITQNLGNEKHKPKPDFIAYNIQKGDRIMLCSDGLNGMLQDSDIQAVISENHDIQKCIKALIDAANQAGGHDNTTIILCDVMDVDAIPPENKKNETSKTAKIPGKKTLIGIIAFFVIGILVGGTLIYLYMNDKEAKNNHNSTNRIHAEPDTLETYPDSTAIEQQDSK